MKLKHVIRTVLFFGAVRILFFGGRGRSPSRRRTKFRAQKNFVDKVNTFIGEIKGNAQTPSVGNVVPVLARPWGATHWAIANTRTARDGWWHNGESKAFGSIRCTNQPSPWIGDYSFFDLGVEGATSFDEIEMTPNYLSLLLNNGVTVEVTPWDHGGVIRLTNVPTKLELGHLEQIQQSGDRLITAVARKSSVFKADYPRYVSIRTSSVIRRFNANGSFKLWDDSATLFIGLSYIDHAQANFVSDQLRAAGFPEVVEEGDATWNTYLARAGTTHDSIFYSNMYRAMLFPRMLSEFLPSGKEMHRSPYDGKGGLYSGPLVTDSGFWDSYRTVYPFLHNFFPEVVEEMYSGWANAIREDPDHMLAQWASPGRVGSMVGAMGEVSMCEGLLEGTVVDPRDSTEIYMYLVRSVTDPNVPNGRAHLADYIDLGYVPAPHGESVSLTLNYMLADFVVSKCARMMGDFELSDTLLERSRGWKTTIWDEESKFFRPKTREGAWYEALKPYEWMGAYTEGGPWQYRFYVPHDIDGLTGEWGGAKNLCDAMVGMMTAPPTVTNRRKIHEELEMQQHVWGQYAHNNQVVHHVLPMMKLLGEFCEDIADVYIQRVLKELYTIDGFAGDEDNGEMAAWYILMTTGAEQYPVVPGVRIEPYK